MRRLRSFLVLVSVLLCGWNASAMAQSLPVVVTVSKNIAAIRIGPSASNPLADITLTFDDAAGLSAASLGISAQTVNINDPALLSRLPSGGSQTSLSANFPIMLTIEPPTAGGLSQHRVTHVEIHTHALTYVAGSSLRLFKAPLSGAFRDITESIAPGSVRARGTTPGWSQFIIVTDLRSTSSVIASKFTYLRNQLTVLPASESAPLSNYLDLAQTAVVQGRFDDADAALDSFNARVSQRAGTFIPDLWRATRDTQNTAGELLSGSNTLKFSIDYLGDFGS